MRKSSRRGIDKSYVLRIAARLIIDPGASGTRSQYLSSDNNRAVTDMAWAMQILSLAGQSCHCCCSIICKYYLVNFHC